MTAYRVAFEKTVALGTRLDILFANIRTGFFYRDNDIVSRNIEKARRYGNNNRSAVCHVEEYGPELTAA